jgi:ubiquinone/menaquinone biosynthesis C-methylase UbiE
MRRPAFIARQSGHPSGLLGRVLASVMGRETRATNVEVVKRLDLRPGDRALEVGFGPGRTLELSAETEPAASFHGIDHSSQMVAVASRRCARFVSSGQIVLARGDSALLPYPSGHFTKTWTVHTLYFWADPTANLREMVRVLAPGGLLVLGFRERSAEAERAFPAEVYRFYSCDEVMGLMHEAGLGALTASAAGSHSPGVIIASGSI